MMEIILAEERYLPEVLEIEQASFSPSWMEGALLSELYNEDAHFTLAVDNGRVLGFCVLHKAADEAELYQIAVAEDARRLGAADLLMADVRDYTDKNGLLCIYLEARRGNTPAINLYKKHGFKVTGCRKKYYSYPTEDAVTMSLCTAPTISDESI